MVIAKKYVLKHEVEKVLSSDLVLVEEKLPPLKDGEYLAKAEHLSIDLDCVYMRKTYPCNSTMDGLQLAKIVESKNPDYPVGKRIVGFLGWRTYTILNPNDNRSMLNLPPYILPDMDLMDWKILPANLGVLGPLGNMAYLALKEMCEAKPGQTLVINGADHSVGVHVGQIAKIMGLNVIGICSSTKNHSLSLRNHLNFDVLIDRKSEKRFTHISTKINKFARDGADLFFDIDGGEISSFITQYMKEFGRIVVCGSLVNYKATETSMNVAVQSPAIVWNKLRMEGLLFSRWYDRWNEGFEQNLQWIREGKLHVKQTTILGFEKMLETFDDVMEGNLPLKYRGKVIVQV